MYIIIAGAGKLGVLLAQKLKADNHQVCVIDKSEQVCHRLAEKMRGILVLQGDAANPSVLKAAKINKADVLVSATAYDEDNMIICHMAKELFSIRRTVSTVNDPKHLPFYKCMDVDVPIDTTSILARIVEEEASFSDVMNLLSIKKGRLSIVRIDIPKEAPVIGKQLKKIILPPNSVLISIIRGTEFIVPSGNTPILAEDEVIAVTLIDNEKLLIKSLIGNI